MHRRRDWRRENLPLVVGGESVVPCNYRLGIRRGFFFNSLFIVCLFVEVLPFLYFFLWFELVSLGREREIVGIQTDWIVTDISDGNKETRGGK